MRLHFGSLTSAFVARGMLAAICLALAACAPAPVIRGDSEKSFRRSVDEVARRVPKERMHALDAALRAIVMARAIGGDADRHSHFVSFTDASAGARTFASPLDNWGAQRAAIVVTRIGRLIDGKTLDEVIELGAREQAALAGRMREWAARKAPDIDWTSRPPPRKLRLAAEDRAALAEISVSQLTLANGSGERPVLSFTIENRSSRHIRALSFAPASEADAGEIEPATAIRYELPMTLAPGAARRVIARLDGPSRASGSLTLVGLEDSRGATAGAQPMQKRRAPREAPAQLAIAATPLSALPIGGQ